MESKTEVPTEESLNKLSNLIKGIKFAMLTTLDPHEGSKTLYSRPMYTIQEDIAGKELWFFTSKNSLKCNQIEHDHNVNVAYADPNNNTFVSVSGRAYVVFDEIKIQELWKPQLLAWFPKGIEDPEVALLRVDMDLVEFWDSTSSKMVYLFKVTKAIFKGETYQPTPGEHVKMDMSGQTIAAE
jgi:general stress protein 26